MVYRFFAILAIVIARVVKTVASVQRQKRQREQKNPATMKPGCKPVRHVYLFVIIVKGE